MPSITCAASNNLAADVQIQPSHQDQHQEDDTRHHLLQAHLLVVLDVMQQMPSMPAEVMQHCCVEVNGVDHGGYWQPARSSAAVQ